MAGTYLENMSLGGGNKKFKSYIIISYITHIFHFKIMSQFINKIHIVLDRMMITNFW